ncbi:MAG TPA: sigma 54-interacting transcriptional regulator [Polyangiaceae bacterium]|nr:sigma 54-interacting transcriptional regulator [Polyangiaceae bacterium]
MTEKARDTTVREESVADAPPRRLVLEWVWPRFRRDSLQGARLSIGRDESAAICLDGTGVSRNHAELYRQGPLYVIRDLGSTNGTWLGGRKVEHAPVAPGSVLRVGEWVGVFAERADDAAEFGEIAPDLFGGAELSEALVSLRHAAASTLPVLVIGETGTGKERVAKAAHYLSGRAGPFLAVNCAALPEALAEAELFGYRRGAFTGAERASPGYFRAAHGGTLFLDEMPELSLALQAKLLRVLEDGNVMSLGESSATTVDIRIVSASQRPLRELVAQGRIRQDLAARLNGLALRLPPLEQRRGDVAALFRQFIERLSGGRPPVVEARLVEALCLHDWPENVRELELVARRLLAVHGHEPGLKRHHLPAELQALNEDVASKERPSTPPRERREHDLARIKEVLAENGGNVKAAASTLGLSRQRIYRLLDQEQARAFAVSGSHGTED